MMYVAFAALPLMDQPAFAFARVEATWALPLNTVTSANGSTLGAHAAIPVRVGAV
jgi:hypothetical protein